MYNYLGPWFGFAMSALAVMSMLVCPVLLAIAARYLAGVVSRWIVWTFGIYAVIWFVKGIPSMVLNAMSYGKLATTETQEFLFNISIPAECREFLGHAGLFCRADRPVSAS